MNIAIVALTKGGAATALDLAQQLPGAMLGEERNINRVVVNAEAFLPEWLGAEERTAIVRYYQGPTKALIREIFGSYEGIILIMATGIAVRSLAPLLQSKGTDPAVVVVDEKGQFAISLVSGHLGGANDLARTVARVLGGTPVITTSTDVQGRLAVDTLARDLHCKLEPIQLIKEINAHIAKGEKVRLLADCAIDLPEVHPLWQDNCWEVRQLSEINLSQWQDKRTVILTSKVMSDIGIFLRPPSLVVGVGCRRGTPGETILAAIRQALTRAGRSPLSVKKLVSIEAKAEEAGIHWAAEQLGVTTEFYPVAKLQQVMQQTEGLAQSEFVNKQMGVKGVCEPASLAGCRQGKIILGKQAGQGITVALAEEEFGW